MSGGQVAEGGPEIEPETGVANESGAGTGTGAGASSSTRAKLFVGRLPEGCSSKDLQELLEKYGAVVECDVVGKFGFVHMSRREDAEKAIRALHLFPFLGSPLTVEFSSSKMHPEPGTTGRAKGPFKSTKRMVGKYRGGQSEPSGHKYQRYGAPPGPSPHPPDDGYGFRSHYAEEYRLPYERDAYYEREREPLYPPPPPLPPPPPPPHRNSGRIVGRPYPSPYDRRPYNPYEGEPYSRRRYDHQQAYHHQQNYPSVPSSPPALPPPPPLHPPHAHPHLHPLHSHTHHHQHPVPPDNIYARRADGFDRSRGDVSISTPMFSTRSPPHSHPHPLSQPPPHHHLPPPARLEPSYDYWNYDSNGESYSSQRRGRGGRNQRPNNYY